MMKARRLLFIPIAGAAIFAGSVAHGASFDYGAAAAADAVVPGASAVLSTGAVFVGLGDEAAVISHTWTLSGLTLTATAYDAISGDDIYAYLDGLSSGKTAGLGAVQIGQTVASTAFDGTAIEIADPGSADNAAFSSGDNIHEVLRLSTSSLARFDAVTLVDADHNPLTLATANVEVSIDGGTFMDLLNVPLIGTNFDFRIDASNTGANQEFYINVIDATAVPVPAAAWMGMSLLGGLGTVGAVKRRRLTA